MRVAVVAAVLALSSSALAEPPGLVPPMETTVMGEKSETLATGLTLAGIALPAALAWSALHDPNDDGGAGAMSLLLTIPAPAIGHWYSNHFGTYGMLARTVGAVFVGMGTSEVMGAKWCISTHMDDAFCRSRNIHDGRVNTGIGIGIYAASWLYDLVTVRREVQGHNEARTVFIAPTVTTTSGGVAVAGAF